MRDWVIFQAYKEFMILEHMHKFTENKIPLFDFTNQNALKSEYI